MKVFISWSGDRSKTVAEALHGWLPNVIQAVRLFMSANDIEKGTRWRSGLSDELEQASVSIICLTPENLESPWILFEAGALSKQQKSSHVCTFLFDIEPVNIREPLAQFQATKAQKDDIEKLIQTINRACGDTGLNEGKLRDTFDVWWPHLEKSLESIPLPSKEHTERRDTTEVLEEILELVRSLSRVDRLSVQRLPVRPRLVTMVKWPPEDAQIVMEHYQEVLKEYGPACADETIQRHLSLLKTDTEYTLKALNYLKTPRKMAELFDVYPWITRLLSDYDDDQIPF